LQSDTHSLSFASDRLPWQRSLRWERPSLDVRRIALGVLLGALATLLELVGFGVGMQWQIAREVRHAPVSPVQVTLVEEQVLPMPPEPEAPAKVARPPMQAVVPQRTSRPRVSSVPIETPQTSVPLQLFDPDGHLRLPESAPPAEGEVAFGAHPTQPAHAFARRNPLPYAPTYFEGAWVPGNESLGREVVRRTTFSHTWRTPWGTQIGCAVSLLALAGGCGWGSAPTATIEELKAMRVDPPMPEQPAASPDEPAATPDGP
jgi:hypothetical protein